MRLVALLLAGCAFEAPAMSSLACEMSAHPGETVAPPDACKMVWSDTGGAISRTMDVCEDGSSCLVLQPGERAFKWRRFGVQNGHFLMQLDPTCTVTCP